MFKQSIPSYLGEKTWRFIKPTLNILVVPFLFFGFAGQVLNLLGKAADLHWLLGLAASLLVLGATVWLLRWIKRMTLTASNFGDHPRISLALNLIFVVLLGIISMALISDLLYQQGFLQYTSEKPINANMLLDYYSWHLIDAIPVFKVWRIFEVEPPAIGEGVWARAMLQFFLVFIVAAGINIFRSKRSDFQQELDSAITYIVKEDYERAERILDDAIAKAKRSGNYLDETDAYLALAKLNKQKGEIDKMSPAVAAAHKALDKEREARSLAGRTEKLKSYEGFLEENSKHASVSS